MPYEGLATSVYKSMTVIGKCHPTSTNSRRFCSSSGSFVGPVFVSRTTNYPLTAGMKYIDVQLLTGQHLYVAVDVRCKAGDIFDCVCSHIGAQDALLFGLCIRVENEYRFLEPTQKLAKCTPKNWAKSGGLGTDMHGQPSVILYLRVYTYINAVRLIRCPVSLVHYYMQLRENVRSQWQELLVREERCYEVAALGLQADFGDYCDSLTENSAYFCPELYFPAWVVSSRGQHFLERHTPVIHRDLVGMDAHEARYRFCEDVSSGCCAVNCHLYRLMRSKGDPGESVLLAIAPTGLQLFENHSDNLRFPVATFPWARIAKLSFDRRKFLLVSVDGQKLTFFTSNDQKARYLLHFCRMFHQNLMRLHDEGRKDANAYCSDAIIAATVDSANVATSNNDKVNGNCCDKNLAIQANSVGQRVSLVSDASSNTTSGIVSDKQRAHDDSENDNEGDLELETSGDNGRPPLVHSDSARSDVSYASKGASTDSKEDADSPTAESGRGGFVHCTNCLESDLPNVGKPSTYRAVRFCQDYPILPSALTTLEQKLRNCHLTKTSPREPAGQAKMPSDMKLRSVLSATEAAMPPFYQYRQALNMKGTTAASLKKMICKNELLYTLSGSSTAGPSVSFAEGQSASLLNLQSAASTHNGSSLFGASQAQPLPDYEEAVMRQHGKRWTTITCIEPSVLSRMSGSLKGQLHQAQSEPGLGAGGHCNVLVQRPPVYQKRESVAQNGCSTSSTSYLTNGSPPTEQCTSYAPASYGLCNTNFGNSATFANSSSIDQLLHNSATNNSTLVSRTQSLQESKYHYRSAAAMLGAIPDRFAVYGNNCGCASSCGTYSLSSSELTSSKRPYREGQTVYCDSCHEEHCSVEALDFNRVKSIIQGQAADLPLIRALCSDHTIRSSAVYSL
uniref:FERM domain-containing protein n=1 Tax=Trichuris muris TaxID=70415 RepID=A0A5S6QWM4_TRIMR